LSQKLSIILSLIFLIGISHSKTINIPDDFSKIQDGISNAINGDTILVEPGTYFENINL